METLQSLLETWGPLAILVGTFFEGETIVLVAGFVAEQGLMDPYVIAITAFIGSFSGDQLWFFMGRRHADHRWIQCVTKRPSFQRALQILERHPIIFILSFRFLYGLRNVSPVAAGFSKIPTRVFFTLNAIAACVWAIIFTSVGYFAGEAVQTIIGGIKAVEHQVFGALGVVILVLVVHWLVRRHWKKPPK